MRGAFQKKEERMKRRLVLLGALGIVIAATMAPVRGADPATGFRGEYIAEVDSVGKKLLDLANAVPAEKYSWRPASGVRSVGEVYVHVAGGNYLIPSFMGVKPPEGINRDMEKTVTEKTKIIDLLKKSLENVKTMAAGMSAADLDKKVKAFGGREVTQRQLMLIILNHMHEHLGQSIAYARSNGVTPPWSEEQPAKKA
jgi:uncharacterized damage-inducible protein DinB